MTSTAQLTSKISEFDPNILVVRSTIVKSDAIAASSNLEVIIRAGAGVDNIELSAAAEAGVLVANCPGANAAAVSELAWSLILACDRNTVSQTLELKGGKWDKGRHADTRSHAGIKGRTLGIVGFGSIGQEVARVGKAMGMQVVVWRRNRQEGVETMCVKVEGGGDMEVGVAATLEELAARSDVVSVHVASSSETQKLLGEAFFGSMRPGSIFINTARGSVVDEMALLKVPTLSLTHAFPSLTHSLTKPSHPTTHPSSGQSRAITVVRSAYSAVHPCFIIPLRALRLTIHVDHSIFTGD